MDFKYVFKRVEELGWAGLVGAGLVLMQMLIYLDPAKVDNWHTWAIAAAGSVVRAFFAAVIAARTATRATPPGG